jgi:hypothetical protein
LAKVLSAKTNNVSDCQGETELSLKTTIDKIKTLEAEKRNLLIEIEELKKMADQKAASLETEVGALRDEVKSLRVAVNGSEGPTIKLKSS